MIIITRTIPTGSFANNSLLYNTVSRLKAIVNATVLSINDVRQTNHRAQSDLSRLTPRAVTNKAGCISSREFRTRGNCGDGSGDIYPIKNMRITVSEGVKGQIRRLTILSTVSYGLALWCRINIRPVTRHPRDVTMEM